MKIAIALILALAMVAPARAKEQVFKEYGFSTEFPLPLTHEPTEAGKDTNDNPTKIDLFGSDVVNDKYFFVRVETFGVVVDKGMGVDDLVTVLKGMTDGQTTMGKPRVFEPYYDCNRGADKPCLLPAIPAVIVLFTKTKADGSHLYLDSLLVLRGNRMYLLRAAYQTQQAGDKDDLEDLLFFVTFKLI
jgi:hypothetical protein